MTECHSERLADQIDSKRNSDLTEGLKGRDA